MNLSETKELIKAIRKSAILIAISLFWLLISPMILVALCATREFNMSRINMYGISWIVGCVFVALCFVAGCLYSFLKLKTKTKGFMQLNTEAFTYLSQCREDRKIKLLGGIIIGVIVCLISLFPTVNLFVIKKGSHVFIEVNYCLLFIFVGIGLGIILGSVIRFLIILSIKFQLDAQANEEELRKKSNKKSKKKSRIIIAVSIILSVFVVFCIMRKGSWYIQPYVATIPAVEHQEHKIQYDESTGIYTITNEGEEDFKILQLTDIHLGGSLLSYEKDLKALQAVYNLINYTHPDLVIVTGDFVFPLGIQSFSFDNYKPIMQFASFMRNIGIPWAFTYGNHDTEFVATHTDEELNELFTKFRYDYTGTLLYSPINPDISGRSNQVILVKNADAHINNALYLIDSNSYKSKKINDYDYIHDDQVEWYEQSVKQLSEKENKTIPSLIFTHIPLQEYKTAYDMYKNGDDRVKYYFGEVGEKNEVICCSEYPSKLFNTALKLGSTKGIFSGHDHYNNISMEYEGIRLTYGMSIDYLAMPGIDKKTDQRGGTLITLHSDSSFDIQQIKLTEIE